MMVCSRVRYHTNGLPLFGRWTGCALESSLVAVLLTDFILRWIAQGWTYFLNARNVVTMVGIVIAACDIVYAFTTPYTWFWVRQSR